MAILASSLAFAAALPAQGSSPKAVRARVVSIAGAGARATYVANSGHWMRTVSVTIRVAVPSSADVDCAVSVRHRGKVIGRSALHGPVPGGGVTIRVGVPNARTPATSLRAGVRCTLLR